MDFILSDALLTIFNEDGNWETGMIRIYNNFTNDFLYPNVNNLLIFAENHDTHRLNHVYLNDIRKYKMAMTLIATVRGIPSCITVPKWEWQETKTKAMPQFV